MAPAAPLRRAPGQPVELAPAAATEIHEQQQAPAHPDRGEQRRARGGRVQRRDQLGRDRPAASPPAPMISASNGPAAATTSLEIWMESGSSPTW